MENEKKTGMKPEYLNYNIMGYRPVEVQFQLDMERVREMIITIISREISNVDSVTFQKDDKTGVVRWFVWFDAASDYFKDSATQSTMLGQKIDRISPEFEKFAKKFGWRPSDEGAESNKVNINNIMKPNVNRELGRNLVGVMISMNAIVKIAFDYDGIAYKNDFGQNKPKTNIYAQYIFDKGPSGKYHNVLGLKIVKSLSYAFENREKPKAKWSGNFR